MTTPEKHKAALEAAINLVRDLTGCKTAVLLLDVDSEKLLQPGGEVCDVYELILSAAGMVCAQLRRHDDKTQKAHQL